MSRLFFLGLNPVGNLLGSVFTGKRQYGCGWVWSCQEAKALDLSRQERVDDEDEGLRTTVKVELLKKMWKE